MGIAAAARGRGHAERFRPRLLLELSGAHLARAGDRLQDVFAFLAALDYRAFHFEPPAGLMPIAVPTDGDFWFVSGDDPAIDGTATTPAQPRTAEYLRWVDRLKQTR